MSAWKLVPVEPDSNMAAAATSALSGQASAYPDADYLPDFLMMWKAAIDRAPAPSPPADLEERARPIAEKISADLYDATHAIGQKASYAQVWLSQAIEQAIATFAATLIAETEARCAVKVTRKERPPFRFDDEEEDLPEAHKRLMADALAASDKELSEVSTSETPPLGRSAGQRLDEDDAPLAYAPYPAVTSKPEAGDEERAEHMLQAFDVDMMLSNVDGDKLRGNIAAALTQARTEGRKAGLEDAARTAAIHNQYPIENDFDRGYDKARKDAAEAIRHFGGG